MGDLPRDGDGVVTPYDDPEAIADDEILVRYIHETQLDPNANPLFPSSAAFRGTSKGMDRYEGMSVHVLSRICEAGVDLHSMLRPGHCGAVGIRAGNLRELGLKIGMDPGRVPDGVGSAPRMTRFTHRSGE